jgi:poly(glycerol-phosphate) alpha-glucosyltransferase
MAGGIFEIERCLARSLATLPDTTVRIYSVCDRHTEADQPLWLPLAPEVFPLVGPHGFGFSPGLQRAFADSNADMAHLHALWMFTSVVVNRWSRKKHRPYVVTLNGMLEPWATQNSRWKKKLALLFYEQSCLDGAACIQANSEAELQSARLFGLRNPVAVIPNGIDLPELASERRTHSEGTVAALKAEGRKVLLYLGRIHPKKGLFNLLRAWAGVQAFSDKAQGSNGKEWVLAVAGWGEARHEEELRLQIANHQSRGSVVLLGPQFNRDKQLCFRNCDAFILPSLSEGLPMAVLEAWSYAKPVLITPECNLPEGFARGAALGIEPSTLGIERGLNLLFESTEGDRQTMGHHGLKLVSERFTWSKVAAEVHMVYGWVLGGGSRPSCVMV